MNALEITDITLCTENLNSAHTQEYYRTALALGVTYVQVPAGLLKTVGDALVPARTVLELPEDSGPIPSGFAAYAGKKSGMPKPAVCTADIGGCPAEDAEEVRWMTDAALFWQDYPRLFARLATDERSAFCPRGAGALGTALAVEWVLAGGRRLTLSLLGAGGYTPLEEVLAALHVCGRLPDSIRLEELEAAAQAFALARGRTIPHHKAVVGAKLFEVESGIHVDGMAKDKRCYEPFAPEAVGARSRIVIGKHSGKHALEMKLRELGLGPVDDLEKLLQLVRAESMETGDSLSDQRLLELTRAVRGGDAA